MLTREHLENNTLLLAGFPHTIRFAQNLHDSDGAELEGEIDHSALTISLDAKLHESLYLAIVLHEVFHGMQRITGHYADEEAARRFGYFFANFLYDNPWLLHEILTVVQYRSAGA